MAKYSTENVQTYPAIGDANYKCTLWTLTQHLTWKCEHVVEFLLFSCKLYLSGYAYKSDTRQGCLLDVNTLSRCITAYISEGLIFAARTRSLGHKCLFVHGGGGGY